MANEELTVDDVKARYSNHIDDNQIDVHRETNSAVDIRPVYDFERELLDSLIEPKTNSSSRGAAVPIKGRWIYGWLNLNGDDYINSIWNNYQFFVRYVYLETDKVQNIGTYRRDPGSYDSMYTFLILLEDLDLVERHKRVRVDQSEYDRFVPEEFRKRTFVRLKSGYEENKEKWDDPFGTVYGSEEEEDIEEIEPESTGGGLSELGRQRDVDQDGDVEDDVTDSGASLDMGDTTMPEDEASIEDFYDVEGLIEYIGGSFGQAIDSTFEQAPIITEDISSDDFSIQNIVILGPWVYGIATPGVTPLRMLVTIDDSEANLSPGFVPSGVQRNLKSAMEEDNPYSDAFPEYAITSAYNATFIGTIEDIIRQEDFRDEYYDLISQTEEEL